MFHNSWVLPGSKTVSPISHFGPTPAHFLLSYSFPICMQMSVNRSHTERLPCICARECLSGCVCHLPEASATARVRPRVRTRARSRVSVHGYCSLKRVCMSTILDRACGAGVGGVLSVCALLSVRSSWRQQGAPFQFTHQPQRRGVKARGITVGDFTFEGQDYQSGDPCEEVMREGGSGGGRGRGERREGRTTRCHPGVRGALFSGERICQAAHLFDTRRCGVWQSGAVWAPSRLLPVLVNGGGGSDGDRKHSQNGVIHN